MLVIPTPRELRLLSSSAQALLRAIMRERDEREIGFAWFEADLDQMRCRARLGSYSTARAALASLRHAGLVATERLYVQRWTSSTSGDTTAAEHLAYAVAGTAKVRSGIVEYAFPSTWKVFVEQCRIRSIKTVRVAAPRPENRGVKLLASSSNAERFSGQLEPSIITNTSISLSPSEKDEALRASSFSEIDPLSLLREHHERRPRPQGAAPSIPPIDPTPNASSTTVWLDPAMPEEVRVKTVIDSYRRACRTILGVEWRAFLRGDVRKSKWYGALVKAAAVMIRESISPDSWAVWRLEFLKAKRGCKSPPPITVVFGHNQIDKMRGFFRTDHQKKVVAQQQVPREHLEQLHRRTEVYNRWRGVFAFMATPTWYRELREQEIRQGFVDPLALYPRIGVGAPR